MAKGMSKRRYSKRPRRVWRWIGIIKELGPESVWISTLPIDHDGWSEYMEFSRDRVPDPELGAVYTIYMHTKGNKTRLIIRPKQLGSWTTEELETIRSRAQTHAAELKDLVDDSVDLCAPDNRLVTPERKGVESLT